MNDDMTPENNDAQLSNEMTNIIKATQDTSLGESKSTTDFDVPLSGQIKRDVPKRFPPMQKVRPHIKDAPTKNPVIPENIPKKTPEVQPEVPKRVAPTTIRSYTTDMNRAMSQSGTKNMANVLEEAREEEAKQLARKATSKQNIVFAVSGAVLFLTGLGLLGYIAVTSVTPRVVQTQNEAFLPTLLAPDHQIAIDTTDASPFKIQGLAKNALTTENKGELNHFYFTDTVFGQVVQLGSTSLFKKLELSTPRDLEQGLSNTMMFGSIESDNDSHEPFFLLKVRSFDRAFAGMLEWESVMLDELKGVLNIDEETLTPESFEESFVDRVVDNKSVRILPVPKNTETQNDSQFELSPESLRFSEINDNEILLVYTFFDDQTLLLTTNTSIVKEIKKRLANQQIFE